MRFRTDNPAALILVVLAVAPLSAAWAGQAPSPWAPVALAAAPARAAAAPAIGPEAYRLLRRAR